MTTTSTYGLYAHSHWQGSGPDRLIAIGSRAAIEHAQSELSTCSFCCPGRVSNYQVGSCYDARPVGYARRSAMRLPDGALSWDRADLSAWLDDVYASEEV